MRGSQKTEERTHWLLPVWSRAPEKAGNSIKYPLTLHHICTMRAAIPTRQLKGKALDEYKRTYKACIPCARRKVKCESEGGKCRRCVTKKLDCVYTSKKPWSRDRDDRPNTQPDRTQPDREESGFRFVSEIVEVFEADFPGRWCQFRM